ncbi:protein CUSTOS-like [Anneissia japonica]|uniref:protein CUSTOS-like n=1 Tax=Anneissia japonica TaxID=1529436 RepID=UPI001425A62F|nr:protein CUSTOS-like [Anneissia japonica]
MKRETITHTSMSADRDSSDSDADEQQRLSSAVWEPQKTLHKLSVDSKCEKQQVTQHEEKRSLRENIDTSDEDYRSLKITPGFRKHVAEKLETFLDSTITESVTETKKQKLEPSGHEGK